jgi:hypothetical protein
MATQSQASGFVDAAQNHVKDGATMGAVAFVANYVVIYLFAVIDGVEGTAEIGTWKIAGWIFYGSHMVDLEASAAGQSQSFGVFEEASGTEGLTSTIPELLYYLVPVVVLLGAGYMLYQRTNARLDTEAAAGLGATVAAGYIVLAAVGTFLFEVSQAGVTIAPKMTTAIALAGLAYPLVLGAVGAAAASES